MRLVYIMAYLEIRLSRARAHVLVNSSREMENRARNVRAIGISVSSSTRRSLKGSAGQIVSDNLPRFNLYIVVQRDRQM